MMVFLYSNIFDIGWIVFLVYLTKGLPHCHLIEIPPQQGVESTQKIIMFT